jgi:hypothetical protein
LYQLMIMFATGSFRIEPDSKPLQRLRPPQYTSKVTVVSACSVLCVLSSPCMNRFIPFPSINHA